MWLLLSYKQKAAVAHMDRLRRGLGSPPVHHAASRALVSDPVF